MLSKAPAHLSVGTKVKGGKVVVGKQVATETGYVVQNAGVFQENSIETCILSRVKQITSPGWMHETNVRTWCTGKTQRDRVEREVGGGIGMGNTCISMADSCQCMTKTTTIL